RKTGRCHEAGVRGRVSSLFAAANALVLGPSPSKVGGDHGERPLFAEAEPCTRRHKAQGTRGTVVTRIIRQPVKMDIVSTIATVPLEIQEEVLLTSSDALSNLTPALVAEANMLQERFSHHYNRTLFGMLPRSRRGESSRRGEGIGSSLDTRRSSKPIDTEGAPLVDTHFGRRVIPNALS
ncbi:hypothetical protein Tco_1100919, partial [Tanacetum coccineum]